MGDAVHIAWGFRITPPVVLPACTQTTVHKHFRVMPPSHCSSHGRNLSNARPRVEKQNAVTFLSPRWVFFTASRNVSKALHVLLEEHYACNLYSLELCQASYSDGDYARAIISNDPYDARVSISVLERTAGSTCQTADLRKLGPRSIVRRRDYCARVSETAYVIKKKSDCALQCLQC